MIFSIRNNQIAQGILTLCIMLLVAAPITPTLAPQKAEAALPTIDWANVVQNTITAVKTAATFIKTQALVVKEYMLDGLGWALINGLIEQMLAQTTQWVASGFRGSPMFVSDFKAFLKTTADNYALSFLDQNIVGFLCEPFRMNVHLAIQTMYGNSRKHLASCRLTDAIRSFDSFRDGNLTAGGGWPAWFTVSMDNNLNPVGAAQNGLAALHAGAAARKGTEAEQLRWGDGFFRNEDCGANPNDWSDEETDAMVGMALGGDTYPPCRTLTPGQSIQDVLAHTLGMPGERLTVADELDELLGALVTQLANRVLGGVGIAGGGSNPYFSGIKTDERMQHDQIIGAEEALAAGAAESAAAARTAAALQDGTIDADNMTNEEIEALVRTILGEDALENAQTSQSTDTSQTQTTQ